MRVLAIDPGYDRLGVAIIEGDASRPTLIWSECVTPPKDTAEKRLGYIFEKLKTIIDSYKPEMVGVETLFFNINKKTALQVAEARGVVLCIAGIHSIPVVEWSPQQIKLAVTGYGAADKKSVEQMVTKLIVLPEKKRFDDELDAIAVGITTLSSLRKL